MAVKRSTKKTKAQASEQGMMAEGLPAALDIFGLGSTISNVLGGKSRKAAVKRRAKKKVAVKRRAKKAAKKTRGRKMARKSAVKAKTARSAKTRKKAVRKARRGRRR